MFDVFYFGEAPKLFPHEQPADSFEHAAELCRTRYFWVVNKTTDYTGFDFLWEPTPWESHQRHAWPSQWQKDSETYLVPKTLWQDTNYRKDKMLWRTSSLKNWQVPANVEDFDYSWHPDPADPPYVYEFGTKWQKTGGPKYVVPSAQQTKYVDQIRSDVKPMAGTVVVIDHLCGNLTNTVTQIQNKIENVTTVRYFDNYLDLLKRISRNSTEEYVWVCSSICDYKEFDFTWHPEQWQATMLHVFASDGMKFGDTFFMHVPTFRSRTEKLELLEWYDINFVESSVARRPLPTIIHNQDTHVNAIVEHKWQGPLVLFSTKQPPSTIPAVPLWRKETKTVVPLDPGAESLIVPRDVLPEIRTQVYDYPYIDKTHRVNYATPQDVIFISNGESMAEQNWQHLKTLCPRAKRSDGVTGREAAYKAAALLSETPWFFAVFAKTEVLPNFLFDFAPDRMQQPKHYIFHSRNPLNGLEYGAMNINLYNKQLVLNTVPGLDFTLSAAHDVVPICASISRFNTDPWVTWRSAFREVLKLKREVDLGADVEIQHRFKVWTTHAEGLNAEHCLQGAQDALAYYEKVQGNLDALKLSFDWAWLQDYYYSLHKTQPWLESI